MAFTKSNTTSPTPFGVYRIEKDYIEELRKADDKVISPDITNRYCGPVYHADTERGPVDFFVPIDPSYESRKIFSSMFDDGIYAEVFDLRKMIPCTNEQVITIDESNKNLISFCNNLQEELETYAEYVMEIKHPDET